MAVKEPTRPVADHSQSGQARPGEPAPVVVVEGLTRTFGRRVILGQVSFTVLEGFALGIVGGNGSGKSVLQRLLASLDRPSTGRIHIHGHDTVRDARQVRRIVGYVPEEPRLYEGITAEQYLQFVGRSRGLGRQVRATSIATLLEVVGLSGEADRQRDTAEYSPGERRKLMLASALLHEPDVLLLDDPLRGLDGQARLEQLEVLRELRRIGTTMVVTATRPEDVLDVCDHLAVLRNGGLAWSGTMEDVRALTAPVRATPSVRVRAEVLDGLQPALTLLSQRRDVSELEVDDDGQTVWFLLAGDRESLAALVPQLVRAGASLAHIGVERRSPAAAVSRLFKQDAA